MSNPYAASNTSMDEAVQPTYEPEIFALSGRLGRIRFLAYTIIAYIVTVVAAGVLLAVLAAVIGANNPVAFGTLAFLLYFLPLLISGFVLAKRRLNDMDQSGWLGLLLLIPLVHFFFWLFLLFAPGTRGPNRYGAEPSANNTALIVVACIFPFVGVAMIGILAAVALPAYQTYTMKAKFSEVVLSTASAKIAVEICAQDRAQPQIAGCGSGANGVPPDVRTPNGMVASVTTADNGVITATAISDKGLKGQTYILIPTFTDGKVSWTKEGTCKTNSPAIC